PGFGQSPVARSPCEQQQSSACAEDATHDLHGSIRSSWPATHDSGYSVRTVMLLFDLVISDLIRGRAMLLESVQRRISLRDLRVLLAVAQTGSMGRAARQLATSQPAISRSISDLEHALGVRLLDRSRQGVVPTPYGSAL